MRRHSRLRGRGGIPRTEPSLGRYFSPSHTSSTAYAVEEVCDGEKYRPRLGSVRGSRGQKGDATAFSLSHRGGHGTDALIYGARLFGTPIRAERTTTPCREEEGLATLDRTQGRPKWSSLRGDCG